MATTDYWNHNVHYQPVILDAVPPGCKAALDIGCGDGMLACKLAARSATVTGIDSDTRMINLAQERAATSGTGNVRFIQADFLSHPFGEQVFDIVCANTSLHHMGFEVALTRASQLVRPGGRLAVVGLDADKSAGDKLVGATGIPAALFYRLTRKKAGPGGIPIKDPDMSWREVRATAQDILPGVRYRRHLMWRYSLLWHKPA
jgi:ubiquinone/menaquinone biosynthesis C-methylase UbiE